MYTVECHCLKDSPPNHEKNMIGFVAILVQESEENPLITCGNKFLAMYSLKMS